MTLVKMEEAQEREAIVKTHEGEEKEARKKKGGEGGRGGGWHITCSDGSEILFLEVIQNHGEEIDNDLVINFLLLFNLDY